MKATEVRGLESYDVLADLLEPIEALAQDEEISGQFKAGNYFKALILALRTHKSEVNQLLAVLDGKDPKTFEANVFTLPKQLVALANDPDVVSLFRFTSLDMEAPSGDAMASTEGGES